MYNRYIPRDDGTYARNRMQDNIPQAQHRPKSQQPPDIPPQPICVPNQEAPKTPSYKSTGFLKQLLPKGFDTGDLIVILLLLLMAGDCEEDRNNAILTIALYFLM